MKQSENVDVGERRMDAGAGIPFRSALVAVGVFFVVAAALNGRALHEDASRRSYGPARDAWMAATAPLAWVSERLKLDRIRAFFEGTLEDE